MRDALKKLLFLSLLTLATAVGAQESNDATFAVHVVQRGDNLFRIALQYNLFAEQVAEANGLTNSNAISVGQRLIIPLVTTAADHGLTHEVAVGETLASIAAAYSKTSEELLTLNSLSTTDEVFIGQDLIIVAGSGSGEPDSSVTPPITPGADVTGAVALGSPEGTPRHSFSRFGEPIEAFVHTVQASETLFEIGLRYNQTVEAIARANNILNPSLLRIGQPLIIPGIQLPRLAQDLPAIIESFTIDPLVFEEGRTGRIELRTTESATVSGDFLGGALSVIAGDEGRRHNILVGIPMFTELAVYPLALTIQTVSDASIPVSANLQVISGGYWRQSITIGDSDLLARSVEDEEIALLLSLTEAFTSERAWRNSLSLPAAAAINALFGTLRSYNGSPFDRYHHGVDFAGAPGTPVMAAANGAVVLSDRLRIRGNSILIDHGWGVYTLYAHLNESTVSPGQQVISGQQIGTIGSTGRSTGPHLHWELWVNGINVDPMQWVQEVFP